MDCQEAQQLILGAGDVDAELAANPAIAIHVAGCADCQKLVRQVKAIDTTAKALPLPDGYARVPEGFLRRIEQEAAAPRRKGCFTQFLRKAVAAALIITVGVMAVALLMFNNSQARADVVLGHLVQWNLDIVAQKDAASRASIYHSKADDMQAQASKLAADDRSLADELLDNAHWLTTESDPQAEGQAFIKIAGHLKSRAAAATDPSASAHLNQVYLEIVHDGIENRVNPASLPPAQQQQWRNIENDIHTAPQNAVPQNPTQPGASLPKGPTQGFGEPVGTIVYAGISPSFAPSSPAYASPSPATNPQVTARSWSSSSTYEPRPITETYAGSSGSSSRSTDSSSSHSNTSSSSAHAGTDATASDSSAKDDPSTPPAPSIGDDTAPAKRSGFHSPFDNPTDMPPTKLATGDYVPTDANTGVPRFSGYKNSSSSDGDYNKPTLKKHASDDSSSPTISSPSSIQTAGNANTLSPLPPIDTDDTNPLLPQKPDDTDFSKHAGNHSHGIFDGKLPETSDDSSWQKSDDYTDIKSWNKSDGSFTFHHGNHASFNKPDDADPTLQTTFIDSTQLQLSPTFAVLPAAQSSPEPASAALLILGGLLLARRRRPRYNPPA